MQKKIVFCIVGPESALREGQLKILDFFFIGASAKKSWERSRTFRYGLLEELLSIRQKQ